MPRIHKSLVKVALAGAALGLMVAASGGARADSLVVWDQYTDTGQPQVMQQLIKNFEKAHQGVTINETERTFDDLSMTLKLTVAAGNGPEVTQVNQGASDQGTMVKQKLLEPLDAYAKKYG